MIFASLMQIFSRRTKRYNRFARLEQLAGAAVFAGDTVVSDPPPMPAASETQQAISQNPDTQMPMHRAQGMGMKHQGKCQHGNESGGKKHGKDKGKHNKHADVVRRLYRIEARMARIEDLLHAMMRR